MNALAEEAVFHESKRILGWGWFGGGGEVLWRKPRLVAKVEPPARDLGSGRARAPFTTLIMPKIRTTRTKKAPDGFEEIEPVGQIYFS